MFLLLINLSNLWVNFREYILKIALTRSILAQSAPNSVKRPGSTRTRWGSLQRSSRHPTWIKGSLLLKEGDGKKWREGVEGGSEGKREGKVSVEGPSRYAPAVA